MSMRLKSAFAVGLGLGLVGGAVMVLLKAVAADEGETERAVKEGEVPAAALSALKKLAGGAAITEFSEEIEHGQKFYEGSWQGPDGHVDGLVTESGDLVEIEESIASTKVPEAVRKVAQSEAGPDAKLSFERKTCTLYEVKFKKGDRGRELLLTPYGRRPQEEKEEGDADEDEDK